MTMDSIPVAKARYIDTAEQAKLVRAALKRAYPDRQFWVRIDRFSMGSSIDVYYIDGPPEREVQALIDQYIGGGFDGSIDLSYSVDSWLLPDGTAQPAHTCGTVGSLGYVPRLDTDAPHGDAELVSFSSHYVHANRSSREQAARYFHPKRGPYVPKEDHG